jgi:NAD(P)-dependent dehydrogenase (short-subunit alcohol dehydrogenase family)
VARIFITGSADGLGQLAANSLVQKGHTVILHARNGQRAQDALRNIPNAEAVVTGDLSSIDETKQLASEVNRYAPYDAVIHNAGVYRSSAKDMFAVNTLAPYVLTSLIQKPKRLIYLTSGMHQHGHSKLDNFIPGNITYSDSKLHVMMLCQTVARHWPEVYANAVNPGWVPTKMGGGGAPDDLHKGYETQVWLAVSNEENAKVSGHYFFHQKPIPHNPQADNIQLQDKFLRLCAAITGVEFPRSI